MVRGKFTVLSTFFLFRAKKKEPKKRGRRKKEDTDGAQEIDGNLVGGSYLKIDASGTFKGAAVVEYADISGTFEGELQVHSKLLIRPNGLILGKVLYGQLEVEQGGRLQGEAQYCDVQNKKKSERPKATASKATSTMVTGSSKSN